MAKELGVTANTLRAHLKKHGITEPVREKTKLEKYGKEVSKLVHTTSRARMCQQLKISHETLVSVLKDLGLQDVFYSPLRGRARETTTKIANPTAKIIYPDGFKITRYVSEPCDDFRSPMKRENYDPKMHAASYGYARL